MEKTTKEGRKVNMEVKQPQVEEQQKMSYDELSKVAGEMQMQGQRLYEENIQLRQALGNQEKYTRMSFLFEVLKYRESFTEDIVENTIEELSITLYPKERESTSEEIEIKGE